MTEQPKGFSTAREDGPENESSQHGGASPQQSAPSGHQPELPQDSGDASSEEHIALESIASLERLRDRVEVASREMNRLRTENRALAERIEELESRPSVDPHGTVLSLDHDPDVLKRKISGFIEAIDSYLENERRRP